MVIGQRIGFEITPFVLACKSGNLKMVKLLLKYAKIKNIYLNIGDACGYTGFHMACKHGHIHVVKELLDNSKCLGIFLNKSPLFVRNMNMNGLVSALDHNRVEVAKLILKHPQGQKLKVPNNHEFKSLLVSLHDEELKDLVYKNCFKEKKCTLL